ncbi:MAG: hypothetical protein PHS97_01225 [Oscillospiraceae bacterium]|nr:hypothetical protein [Oscillospiraceae bacterium]
MEANQKTGTKKLTATDWIVYVILIASILGAAALCLRQFGVIGSKRALRQSAASVVTLHVTGADGTVTDATGFVCYSGDTVVTTYDQMTDAYDVTFTAPDGASGTLDRVVSYEQAQNIVILASSEPLGLTPLIDAAAPVGGSKAYALSEGTKFNSGKISAPADDEMTWSGTAHSGTPLVNGDGIVVGMACADGAVSIADISQLWLSHKGLMTLPDYVFRDTPLGSYIDMIYASIYLMEQQADELYSAVRADAALSGELSAELDAFSAAIDAVRAPVADRTLTPDTVVPMWQAFLTAAEDFSGAVYARATGDAADTVSTFKQALSGYRQMYLTIESMAS